MKKFDEYFFRVPEQIAIAIVNGDESGLENTDIYEMNRFIDRLVKEYGHAHLSIDNSETFFVLNDLNPFRADCLEMTLLVDI